MKASSRFRGVIPILPTPFTAGDEVDTAALERLLDFAVSTGAAAVGTPAFASEFYKLDEAERTRVLETVIAGAKGRVRVIAQCNHHAPRHAARFAREAEAMGASAINIALPRAFPSSPAQLLNYARTVCDAVGVPVVVQDWNPAGASVGAAFAAELLRHCPNFAYLKLEDAGASAAIREISAETDGKVQVFSGWGGMYLLDQHPAGACGIMPGLGIADVLVQIWRLLDDKKPKEAAAIFAQILPYLQFSLESLEQHHHVDKQLLVARGVLSSAIVRSVTIEMSAKENNRLRQLMEQLRPLLIVDGKRHE